MAVDRLAYKLVMDHSQFVEGAISSRKEMALARQVMFDTLSPAEKLEKAYDSLAIMQGKGLINCQQYSEAVKQLQANTQEAKDAAAAAAAALTAQLEAEAAEQKKQNALLSEAAKITASVATSTEIYAAEQAKLNEHLQAGRLTQETYERALAKAFASTDEAKKMAADTSAALAAEDKRLKDEATAVASALAVENKRLDDAARITASVLTPTERYDKQLANLKDHLAKGRITQETYNRAVGDLAPKAQSATSALLKKHAAFLNIHPAILASGAALAVFGVAALAAKKIINEVTEAVQKQFEEVGKLKDLSTSLGIGTSELVTFGVLAKGAGSDLEGFNRSLKTMEKNLGGAMGGTGEVSAWLGRFKLSVSDLKALRPEDQFLALTDAISKLPTQLERADAANAIFGKGAEGVLRMLTLTKDEFAATQANLEAYGFAISDLDATAIDDAGDAVAALSVIWEGLARVMAAEIAPALIVIAKEVTEFAKSGDAVIYVKAAFVGLRVVLEEVAAYLDVIRNTARLTYQMVAGLKQLATGDIKGFTEDFIKAQMPDISIGLQDFFAKMEDTRKEIAANLAKESVEAPVTIVPKVDWSPSKAMLAKLEREKPRMEVEWGEPEQHGFDDLVAGIEKSSKDLDKLLYPPDGKKPKELTEQAAKFAGAIGKGSQEDIAIRAAAMRQTSKTATVPKSEEAAIAAAKLLFGISETLESIDSKTEGVVVTELSELPT